MKTELIDNEYLSSNLNEGKNLLLEKLHDDGVISDDVLKDYTLNYLFVVQKPKNISVLCNEDIEKYSLIICKQNCF